MNQEKVIQLRVKLISDTKQLNNIKRSMSTLRDTTTKTFGTRSNALANQMEVVRKTTTSLNKEIDRINKKGTPFAGWAMSIMFAGMAVQRLGTQLKQFGTKAYDEITHSVEGSSTANDRLTASMTMLGYSVGEALQPMLDSIIPIIDAISEWVEKNPELVAGITKWSIILGAMAASGGAIVLAYNGFKDLFTILSTPFGTEGFMGLTLTSPLILALAAAAVSMGIFATNVDDNPALKEGFSGVIDKLKDAFKGLVDSLDDLGISLDTVGGLLFFIGGVILTGLVTGISVVVNWVTLLSNAITLLVRGLIMLANPLTAKSALKGMASDLDSITSSALAMRNAIATGATFDAKLIKNVVDNGIGLDAQLGIKDSPKMSTMADNPAFKLGSYQNAGPQIVFNNAVIQTTGIEDFTRKATSKFNFNDTRVSG